MVECMQTLRGVAAKHRQRRLALCGNLWRFACDLHHSFGDLQTSYVARDIPQCPDDDTDLPGLSVYVCRMLEFMVAWGCTAAGASHIENVRRSMHQTARLSAQVPCALDTHSARFAVACLLAVAHQTPIPVDAMLQKAIARADAVEPCSDTELEMLLLSMRKLPEAPTDSFAALDESFDEEQGADLNGFVKLSIAKEACCALDGDSVQELIGFIARLEQGYAAASGALAHTATACGLDVQFSPHTSERLSYAQLHAAFMQAFKAAQVHEEKAWAETVRDAKHSQQAARRAMLILQAAFEHKPTICDEPKPFTFLKRNIPNCRTHHHLGAVCEVLERFVLCCTHPRIDKLAGAVYARLALAPGGVRCAGKLSAVLHAPAPRRARWGCVARTSA